MSRRSEVKRCKKNGRILTPPHSVRSPYPHDLVPRVGTKNHRCMANEKWVLIHLLIILFLRGTSADDEAGCASSTVMLVLDGQLGEMANHVLNGSVSLGTSLATEVVQPGDISEDSVDSGNNNGDTNGVGPDDDNSDNAGVTVGGKAGRIMGVGLGMVGLSQPTEDTEESSQDIDTEDGADELPGRIGLATTGNKDQPVLSKSNLKEDDTLVGTEVLNETTVGHEHGTTDDPGTGSK